VPARATWFVCRRRHCVFDPQHHRFITRIGASPRRRQAQPQEADAESENGTRDCAGIPGNTQAGGHSGTGESDRQEKQERQAVSSQRGAKHRILADPEHHVIPSTGTQRVRHTYTGLTPREKVR
jgi:hypothetical protein